MEPKLKILLGLGIFLLVFGLLWSSMQGMEENAKKSTGDPYLDRKINELNERQSNSVNQRSLAPTTPNNSSVRMPDKASESRGLFGASGSSPFKVDPIRGVIREDQKTENYFQ